MEKYGPLTLVNLPKKEGKLVGYGFVVFEKLADARKAMEDLNAKTDKFMGTKVAVDWCLPKNLYLKNALPEKTEEEVENSDSENKDEDDEEDEEDEDDENDKDEDDEDEKPVKNKRKLEEDKEEELKLEQKRKVGTIDVQEQRTVFVRNLSYDATEDMVKESFLTFGPIKYVKLCYDRDLERPKGTAFIQFENSQDALKACDQSEHFEMDSRRIQIDMAVSREKASDLIVERKRAENEPKDNRNLVLAKEGIIYPNSYEAKDVSKADMIRRQKLEEGNKLKLQILHYFVSPTRLSVHNLPIKCTDQELRQIFQTAIGEDNSTAFKSSGITECRIMRDLARVNSEGVYRSKGFGFVELSTTLLAKKALHAVNNNPNIFKNGPRPIVQFSIEDMRALKKKQERYEKAQAERRKNFTTHKKPNGFNGKAGDKFDKKPTGKFNKDSKQRFNNKPDKTQDDRTDKKMLIKNRVNAKSNRKPQEKRSKFKKAK